MQIETLFTFGGVHTHKQSSQSSQIPHSLTHINHKLGIRKQFNIIISEAKRLANDDEAAAAAAFKERRK